MNKNFNKIFVRGLLRSNDPKVAVMPATAAPLLNYISLPPLTVFKKRLLDKAASIRLDC